MKLIRGNHYHAMLHGDAPVGSEGLWVEYVKGKTFILKNQPFIRNDYHWGDQVRAVETDGVLTIVGLVKHRENET